MGQLKPRVVAMAVANFAESLIGSALLCITDNAEADLAIYRRSSKISKLRHLIKLIGIIAHRSSAPHPLVKGNDNWRADLLSKHQVDELTFFFFSQRPERQGQRLTRPLRSPCRPFFSSERQQPSRHCIGKIRSWASQRGLEVMARVPSGSNGDGRV